MDFQMFKDRSAIEIVMLVWASTVAVFLLITTVGVITGKILHPEIDASGAVGLIANVVMAIIGYVGGYFSGKREGKMEANGEKP